ncbi:MAG: DUF1489 domain-containing protein [Proteobacteria bacterium]|nr:DUF1489 domain-containing protein [Pseudomonadota bacterium]
MTVHLIKLCVGIEDVPHLARVHRQRLAAKRKRREKTELVHVTRSTPKRAAEILDGGSIYWVIKGVIRVRQKIVELRAMIDEDGKSACGIVLENKRVETERKSFRAFQGWRYLNATDAPLDLRELAAGAAKLPDALASELKDLGLL